MNARIDTLISSMLPFVHMQSRATKSMKDKSSRQKEETVKNHPSIVSRNSSTGRFVAGKAAREVVKRYGEAMKSLSAK